jgi:IS1 family transposase
MNKLDTAKRTQIVTALVEGMGIRATARLCDVTKGAVSKLLADMGTVCAEYHNLVVRDVNAKRVQADEIWSFCHAKVRTVRKNPDVLKRNPDAGDVWTWTALDADSKLMISYLVGARTADNAYNLLADLKSRITSRIQLTTDQLTVYMRSADRVFGIDVDYAMIHKIYAPTGDTGRYSPPACIGCEKRIQTGDPDPKHISTSYVERANLTMRMHMRRFTRLTNAFSKKLDMHKHAVALHFAYYNFCKIHETLRVTPAMAAEIATYPWTVADLVKLLERVEAAA